ncbi:MAG: lysophospholipid acyltransferase family protein [Gammaproteobacteria bacterium]|nr:lysophospholipid acyltransferase family protein [Gammaproteobacteria bacterium]
MASPTRRRLRRLGFHLLGALAHLCRPFGMTGIRCVGEWVGELRFRVNLRERRRIESHIAEILGAAADGREVRRLLRHAYRVSDRSAFEIVAMGTHPFPSDTIRAACTVDRIDRLQAVVAQGSGAILLGMHMTNGILMAARLATEGLPVTVVYRESRKMRPGFFADLLSAHGLQGIDAGQRSSAYRQMLRALRAGRIIYVLMDQGTKHGGVSVDFLGKTLDMPAGPAELARRSGVPVLPALALGGEASWRFVIGEALELDDGSTEASAATLAASMERHIRSHPELWSWHHRKWRRFPITAAGSAN